MPLEYAADGTTYVGAPPPKAKGAPVNLYLACAAAGIVVAGALLPGVTDLFDGHQNVVSHTSGTANGLLRITEGKGAITGALGDASEALGDTAKAAGGAVKDGANYMGTGTVENLRGLFGGVQNTELGKIVTSLSAPDTLSLAELKNIPDAQALFSSGQSGIITLPNGNLLVQDHGKIIQFADEAIQKISPEMLEKHSVLRELHEARFGKPIDVPKIASTLGFGGAVGLGAAALIDNNQQQQQTSNNPYMQAQSMLQAGGNVAYHNRVTPPQLRAATY
jgi:hypothetical protein